MPVLCLLIFNFFLYGVQVAEPTITNGVAVNGVIANGFDSSPVSVLGDRCVGATGDLVSNGDGNPLDRRKELPDSRSSNNNR